MDANNSTFNLDPVFKGSLDDNWAVIWNLEQHIFGFVCLPNIQVSVDKVVIGQSQFSCIEIQNMSSCDSKDWAQKPCWQGW